MTDQPPVDTQEPLATEFPEATVAEWEALVRSKAKNPEAPLATTLEDGIEVAWLYTPDDALAPDPAGLPDADPFVRGTRAGTRWEIRQENGTTDRRTANAQILEDLEGGATEVLLRVDPDGVKGIPVTDADGLDEVLEGVYLDLAPVALEAGPHGPAISRALVELWRRRDVSAAELRGSLRLDPLGVLARSGGEEPQVGESLALVTELRAEFPRVQVLAVDTDPYVDAGAGAVPELALAIATGIAYLRAAEDAGIDPAVLAGALEFTLVAGPDQFLEIAKLRAARRMWASVLRHCEVDAVDRYSRVYVRTSRRMVSALDPWVNMLRATTAVFAAGVGGADGVTVLPFDEPVGEPGPLGRRIARNTQLVLQEEGQLFRVADPAGGSWYVESLTDQLAQAAWSRLQELERSGGIIAALTSGQIADELAADTARRQDDLARRRRALTGVNTFPLLGDDGLDRSSVAASPALGLGEAERALAPVRDAAAFEALRARAVAITEATGREPAIFLANMGPLSSHVNIALWAKNFFEAGGVVTVSGGVQPDDAAQAAAFSAQGVRFAAICPGRDAEADAQASLVSALREAGAEAVYVAGAKQDAATAVGADVGVRDGVDMVEVLGALLDRFDPEGATR
jgi:methylmalonyl-CoA mutase